MRLRLKPRPAARIAWLARIFRGIFGPNADSGARRCKIHTPEAGSPELDVPLVQMNALLGFVATAVTQTFLSFGLDRQAESRLLLPFGKLLWIQNDLITRHYQLVASGGR
ncbi:MAG: protoglobin domain-containing protein [Planctomycetia bacterium]